MLLDFGDAKQIHTEEESNTKGKKLDISDVLKNIDETNYDYYKNLSPEEQKQFTPYVVLRFLGSLDDSVQLMYKAKDVESVFGKWSSGGKDTLNELRTEFNTTTGMNCSGVKKYEHAKYDWRISFSVANQSVATALSEYMKEFGVSPYDVSSLISPDGMKNYIIMLNELVNVNFWEMQNHPELVYELMCSVSEVTQLGDVKRNWIPFAKGMKNADQNVLAVVKRGLSELAAAQLNETEYVMLLSMYDKKSYTELLTDMGTEPKEQKEELKRFEKERKKYAIN